MRVALFITLLVGLNLVTKAQTASRPDRGLMAGGSYAVSDIETINQTNGNLSISIPLAALPPVAGGKLGWVLRAQYHSKLWDRVGTERFYGWPLNLSYTENAIQLSEVGGWSVAPFVGYGITLHSLEDDYIPILPTDPLDPETQWTGYKWKMVLTTPDGAKHELDALPVTGASWPRDVAL